MSGLWKLVMTALYRSQRHALEKTHNKLLIRHCKAPVLLPPMKPQKLLGHRRERGDAVILGQQSAQPILRRLLDDAVGRVAAGETDVAGITWGG